MIKRELKMEDALDKNNPLRTAIEQLAFLAHQLGLNIGDAIYHLSDEQIDAIAKELDVTRDEAIAILKKSTGTDEVIEEKEYEHISIALSPNILLKLERGDYNKSKLINRLLAEYFNKPPIGDGDDSLKINREYLPPSQEVPPPEEK